MPKISVHAHNYQIIPLRLFYWTQWPWINSLATQSHDVLKSYAWLMYCPTIGQFFLKYKYWKLWALCNYEPVPGGIAVHQYMVTSFMCHLTSEWKSSCLPLLCDHISVQESGWQVHVISATFSFLLRRKSLHWIVTLGFILDMGGACIDASNIRWWKKYHSAASLFVSSRLSLPRETKEQLLSWAERIYTWQQRLEYGTVWFRRLWCHKTCACMVPCLLMEEHKLLLEGTIFFKLGDRWNPVSPLWSGSKILAWNGISRHCTRKQEQPKIFP